MVHVVFSTSEKGSLRVALSGPGGAAAVAVIGGAGGPLGRLAAKREAARQRQRAAGAPPMEGRPADVVCLPLALSVGDISETEPGEKRKAELAGLWAMDSAENAEVAEKMLAEARGALETLRQRAACGEVVRVWQSPGADAACGIRSLAAWLRPLGFDKLRVERVRLPEFEARPDGTAVRYDGWGEVEPWHWAALADPTPLPAPALNALAQEWALLAAQNAPPAGGGERPPCERSGGFLRLLRAGGPARPAARVPGGRGHRAAAVHPAPRRERRLCRQTHRGAGAERSFGRNRWPAPRPPGL